MYPGFFSLDRMDRELVDDINQQDYDLAIIVYNNTKGRGYENVEEVVAALRIKAWMALSSEGVILKQDDIKRIRNEERTVCGC